MKVCRSCAKPLKQVAQMNRGQPRMVWVCKSPICKRYGKPQ